MAGHLERIPEAWTRLIERRLRGTDPATKGPGTLLEFMRSAHLGKLSLQEEIDRYDLRKVIGFRAPAEMWESRLLVCA